MVKCRGQGKQFGRLAVISTEVAAQALAHSRVPQASGPVTSSIDRTDQIKPDDILVFSTLRNEQVRLPYFLKYYREMGVNHFLMVDNGCDDGSREYLAEQPDVSLWSTDGQLQAGAVRGRLAELAAIEIWPRALDAGGRSRRIPGLPVLRHAADPGADRLAGRLVDPVVQRDAAGHVPQGPDRRVSLCRRAEPVRDRLLVRQRQLHDHARTASSATCGFRVARARASFFPDKPERAPALNKIPLVKWDRRLCLCQLDPHAAAARSEPGL